MNKKTRIDVKIFKTGNILEYITPMIAQANGNGGGLTPQDIAGYINCMKHAADYRRKWSYTITENGDGMVITEDGGYTAVFSLAWVELHELQRDESETERAVKWWNELDEGAKAELLKQNATYGIALPTMPGEIVTIYRNAPNHLKAVGDDQLTEDEKLFLKLWEGCEEKTDTEKYPHSVFWFKDGNFMFELDKKNGIIWCSYSRVWNVLSGDKQLGYHEIQNFIKIQVEKYFKMKDVTPKIGQKCAMQEVEKYFKMKDSTNKESDKQ